MTLFVEYAVTPDVFNVNCYKSPELCDVHCRQLYEAFFDNSIVRNLRNGDWEKFFSTPMVPWQSRIRHVLKDLTKAGRLIKISPALNHNPQNEREWCEEALASHNNLPLNSIIVSEAIKRKRPYLKNSLVEDVNKFSRSTNSIRLKRHIDDYKDALKLILKHANSIMFIDPYIAPEPNYHDFFLLLEAAGNRTPQPHVEIHRKILRGSGQYAPRWGQQDMEDAFRKAFNPVLLKADLKIKVFVWDNFHDRYLISNLGGIHMSNGFDTSKRPHPTTWSRLGRSVRDEVQREFDQGSIDHTLQFTFEIP